jgi:hypothetical protein
MLISEKYKNVTTNEDTRHSMSCKSESQQQSTEFYQCTGWIFGWGSEGRYHKRKFKGKRSYETIFFEILN